MKRLVPLSRALLALALLAYASFAGAAERILSFDSTITVQRDGTLEVREAIRVRAEGNQIRRGIYRDFPTTYPTRDGRPIIVGFDFQSASRDGQPEQWRTEGRSNGVRIYLGSPNVIVPRGEHTYEIVYRTDRQMGFFADHDELYWNVTGNGWIFDIDRATARLLLPPDIPRDQIKLDGYTGPQGSTAADFTSRLENDAPVFTTTRALGPREGLTIVAMWPKGFITPGAPSDTRPTVPSALNATPVEVLSPVDAYFREFKDGAYTIRGDSFWTPVAAAIGLAVLLLYYAYMWHTIGRDPPAGIVVPHYEPPPGQSPAAMRFLTKMGYDDRCFAAGVLSLAVKGHLRIEEAEKGLLGLSTTTTLVRTRDGNGQPLSDDEKALLGSLFKKGDRLLLTQSSHEIVSGARSAHQGWLRRQLLPRFFRINGRAHGFGWVISLLALGVTIAVGNFMRYSEAATPSGMLVMAACALIGLIANFMFGWLLKAPTVAGRAVMDHINGFTLYLRVAEGEELKRMKGPPPPLTPQLYESYLPAALALGVEQRWAERFSAVLDIQAPNYSPHWYSGDRFNVRDVARFSSGLSASLDSAISAASTAPGSESGARSSGGSSGSSGSSGGGGGGGGGGGW
jgi:uncharacterized membrane protein YgcG